MKNTLLCLVAIAGISLPEVGACAADRPNVVFVLVDDYGWRDVGIEGSTFYETPNIDRLAQSGMRFLQGYATCQVCSPSRASIMTGKFTARHGITDWIGAAEGTGWKRNTRLLPARYVRNLPAGDTTLAEAFQAAGYRTFFAGKWHLGSKGSWPTDHGFDENVGGFDAGSPRGGYFSPFKNPNLADGPAGQPLPRRLAEETCRFIEANGKSPFLAYLAFYSVHAPIQSTEALWKKYRDKAAAMPTPDHRFIIDRTSPVRQVQDHPVYAGMVEAMDSAVGMVLDTLDRLGLDDNTIVVLTGDNGGVSAGDGKATSNLPLRGGKGRQWEGGIREPFYIRWPGVVPPGSTTRVPATGADFFPTLLDMAGLDLMPDQHVDGMSLVPVLKGGTLPPRPLYWHYPHYGNQGGEPSSIVREGEWKLIHYYEDGRDELYNLKTDPIEQTDLAARQPQRVRAMADQLTHWLRQAGARFPVPNPGFDAAKYAQQQRQIRTTGISNLEKQAARFLQKDYDPGNRWWGSTVDD